MNFKDTVVQMKCRGEISIRTVGNCTEIVSKKIEYINLKPVHNDDH